MDQEHEFNSKFFSIYCNLPSTAIALPEEKRMPIAIPIPTYFSGSHAALCEFARARVLMLFESLHNCIKT